MLHMHSVNTYYGDSHILHDVDFRIGSGRSVGLLGRNGMGKTTLIRSMMGFVPAASGKIEWKGKDVTGEPPERMARLGIGYVPEGRGIFPNLSVRENLVMSARAGVNGRKDWTCERILNIFPRLKERLNHGGQQLSGGEQQMLSIGRALMTNPELLILDEATEGLAPLIVRQIWRVIRQIGETGISTLIVDRNYRAVLGHTDEAVVMEKGRIVLADESAALSQSEDALKQYLGA
jgi:branched-chain amino acid transport system ATP-binding protein